jgi:hypothetical protein
LKVYSVFTILEKTIVGINNNKEIIINLIAVLF